MSYLKRKATDKHHHYKMKKRRGLKRYYRRLRQCNELDNWRDILSDKSRWSYFDHLHFDRNGYGNVCWKERKEHLDVLFRHFLMIEQFVEKMDRPFQIFAILVLEDSRYDALFLHTPNYHTPEEYPYIIPAGYKKEYPLRNPSLRNYLVMLAKQGYTVFSSEEKKACIVFKEHVGDSLYENHDNKRLNLPCTSD